jgi:hypothetical protein
MAKKAAGDRISTDDDVSIERLDRLREAGIMIAEDLGAAVRSVKRRADIVEGLIREQSITLLIGNSTIGKTPFVLQLLLCLAAGIPFLGRAARRCRVLYLAGEGDQEQLHEMIRAICGHLGIGSPPDTFMLWSPHWDDRSHGLTAGNAALMMARRVGADVTAADPLRVFWPEAEARSTDAAKTYAKLRKIRTAFVIPHHLRKPDRKLALPDLATDPNGWLVEASGSRALVTGADVRLGIEARTEQQVGDLLVCGLARGRGQVGPLYLERAHDEAGDPIGYTSMQGLKLLSESDRVALQTLPTDHSFRFSDAKRALGGNSDSNTSRFLHRCMALELVYRVSEHYQRDRDKDFGQ